MHVKVKLILYMDSRYLVFDDGRLPNVGDRVLHPFIWECGAVTQVYENYKMSNYDFISIEGVGSLISRWNRSVVAAKWDELRDEDKANIDENATCFVAEENGNIKRYDDQKIAVFFSHKSD